jgi:hypothetical protein
MLVLKTQVCFNLGLKEAIAMTLDQVLDHYGGITRTADALAISYQAVHQWADKGEVPAGRQWEIQAQTKGKLTAVKNAA